jgi:hypothetical protein
MGIPNSIAIEFDTWSNTPADYTPAPGQPFDPYCEPRANHISVQTKGTLPNNASHCGNATAGLYLLTEPIQPNQIYLTEVSYRPGTLNIYWQSLSDPVLSVPMSLEDLLNIPGGKALAGWTASTGGAWETHEVLLSGTHIESVMATPEPQTMVLLALGLSLCLTISGGKIASQSSFRRNRSRPWQIHQW